MSGPRPAASFVVTALLALSVGGPAAAVSGGPDGFGYTWYDSDNGCPTSPPLFGSGAQTLTNVTDLVGPLDLAFRIPWYGVEGRRVWIDPTGYIAFRDPVTSHLPDQEPPDFITPNGMLAAHWVEPVDVTIRWEETANSLHVQWQQLVDPAEARFITDLVIDDMGNAFLRYSCPYQLDFTTIGHEDLGGIRGRTIYASGVGENGYPGPRINRSICIEAPQLLDCTGAEVIRCNESVLTFIPFENDSNASVYSCAPADIFLGDEKIFRLIVDDLVSVSISHDAPPVTMMRVENPPCSEDLCVDYGPFDLDYALLYPGEYWIVLDQREAAASLPFNLSVDCQEAYTRIDCGETLPGDTLTMNNFFRNYSCAMDPLTGPEVLYRLNNPTDQTLTAVLDTMEPNLWVVIFDADDFEAGSEDCLAAGRGGASVIDAPAGEYVVVVDGSEDAGGAYSLTVSCGQMIDCAAVPEVDCLEIVNGDTSTAENVLVSYNCERDALISGENVHHFTNPVQQTVRASFLSSQPGQRLLLLTDCSSGACLVSDEISVSCPRLPPGDFYFVVDGPPGSEGPYQFEVECGRVDTGIDLQVLGIDTGASASDCRSFDLTGTAEVIVTNLGTDPATAPFDLVLFEDLAPQNGVYDVGVDQLAGTTTIMADLVGGGLIRVPVDLSGSLSYRDAILHAQVDPDDVVTEFDEGNNAYDTGLSCEYRSPIGDFLPILEWEWKNPSVMRDYDQVDSTPMVADVNGDGVPDVVVATGANVEGFDDGVVRALSGDDGRLLWTADDPQARVWMTSNLALADLDGDLRPEIIAHSYRAGDVDPPPGQRLVAIDDDGSFMWVSEPFIDHPEVIRGGGGASIADLDCDGNPEIVYGKNVFNADGSYYWAPAPDGTLGVNDDGRNLDGALSVVVDVDGDGELEVVAGPTCYELDPLNIDPMYGVPVGRIKWRAEFVLDGFPAVGQFDGDALPEIAITNYGFVTLLEGDTGEVIWERSLPLGGGGCSVIDLVGGPPTIADVDGDCAAEIGVAGADWFFVLETNGTIKWQKPIVDCSSHRTACSVFDFDGNGATELAFMDEEFLYIFNGKDGELVEQLPASSHTWQEMITIADVDADNNAEIIMPLNSPLPTQPHGIRVIGDLDGAWVNTRRVWNQHAYHINNINDDLTVPGPGNCEAPSWIEHNTYRDQLGEAVFTAPDVTMGILDAELIEDGCQRSARIQFRMGNGGGVAVPAGSEVWFYDGDPAAGGTPISSEMLPTLAPGMYRDITVDVPLIRVGLYEIFAVADDDGTGLSRINECREFNNSCSVMIDNPGFPMIPPDPVGPALRATRHSDPYGAMIDADFEWVLDAGLPRPAGDHYHFYRSTLPNALAWRDELEVLVDTSLTDSTVRARDDQLPHVHFYKVFAADECEQEEEREDMR